MPSTAKQRRARNAELRTAHELRELLAQKHAEDIFVPECKTGSTGEGLLKLDAWAMKKSWADPLTWGYEIKVSRGDFVGDNKWHRYLRYCSEFYFVAPIGVIDVDELPPEVGLLVCASTGSRLLMKKKPQRRQVVVPEDLFRYVLMWRTTGLVPEHQQNVRKDDPSAYWREWLAKREEDREIGWNVSRSISKLVRERITTVECNQKELESRLAKYAEIEVLLKRLGFNLHWAPEPKRVEARLLELDELIPNSLVSSLECLSRTAHSIVEQIEQRKQRISGTNVEH